MRPYWGTSWSSVRRITLAATWPSGPGPGRTTKPQASGGAPTMSPYSAPSCTRAAIQRMDPSTKQRPWVSRKTRCLAALKRSTPDVATSTPVVEQKTSSVIFPRVTNWAATRPSSSRSTNSVRAPRHQNHAPARQPPQTSADTAADHGTMWRTLSISSNDTAGTGKDPAPFPSRPARTLVASPGSSELTIRFPQHADASLRAVLDYCHLANPSTHGTGSNWRSTQVESSMVRQRYSTSGVVE
jgi:hypothetical protein